MRVPVLVGLRDACSSFECFSRRIITCSELAKTLHATSRCVQTIEIRVIGDCVLKGHILPFYFFFDQKKRKTQVYGHMRDRSADSEGSAVVMKYERVNEDRYIHMQMHELVFERMPHFVQNLEIAWSKFLSIRDAACSSL